MFFLGGFPRENTPRCVPYVSQDPGLIRLFAHQIRKRMLKGTSLAVEDLGGGMSNCVPKGGSISVITSTLNASRTIDDLARSLVCQTDQDFEWIVCDGGSEDDTLRIVESYGERLDLIIILGPGFGIYDAINRAIAASRFDYYVVVGADDLLFPTAISDFRAKAPGFDLTAFGVVCGDKLVLPRDDIEIWTDFAAHSVGLVIRKCLHEKLGFYQQRYAIAADTLLIRLALRHGASVASHQIVVGCFSLNGISSRNYLAAARESFKIRIEMGENRILCYLRLGTGVLKNLGRIVSFELGARGFFGRRNEN